ncbi:hypothetical protein Acr_00g0056190 [Actinidia rufa]|uniref:CCHC-type domain-containing protein n=1 Tax=Actinidia rufa TaxID=165716 RepID=A0A7J0DM54_9ERIC|nr:hypothetical protein Acr_00g0056190 [Actinidia rufa]
MTIAEYEAAFTNLAVYAPHLVATDEMRAQRFEEGLRYEIKRVVRPMVLPMYAEVLDRAIIVEQDEEDRKRYQDHKRCQNFQNDGSSWQKHHKVGQSGKNNKKNQRRPMPTCPTCEKNHSGECWWKVTSSHCFNCKEVGHLKKDCPKLKTRANAVPVMGYGGRNAMPSGNENRPSNSGSRSGSGNEQRQGRVFAIMPGDSRNNEDVVVGTILICSIPAYALFDSGSLHTFISTYFF